MGDDEGVTLFVRKLPQDVEKKEVENIFSNYGPMTKCFVVPVKGELQVSARFSSRSLCIR
jgi:RNA recognition motif-containing protein